ncbi:MAG TPA: response regulator [Terriglobia bacterium]|nr:response regulator [Terriglobia bacterium]
MVAANVEILIVEDNADDAELALHALRRENLANAVEIARDGEEALDFMFCRGKFSHRTFDRQPRLVLLDLKLPKVNGLEVLRELKNDPRTKMVPVVILTTSREDRDMVSGYQLGVNAYIQKPVDFDQFREMVKRVGLYWLVTNQPPPVAPGLVAPSAQPVAVK